MTNWQREIAKFAPDLSVGVYHAPTVFFPKRQGSSRCDADNLRFDAPGNRETCRYKWRLLVLDEAQAVKNAASGQSVAAKSIKPRKLSP